MTDTSGTSLPEGPIAPHAATEEPADERSPLTGSSVPPWTGLVVAGVALLAAGLLLASCGVNSNVTVDAAEGVDVDAEGEDSPAPMVTPTAAPTPTATPTVTPTPTPTPTATPIPDPWIPQPGTTWQWQLSGALVTDIDVAMYDVDLFDVPVDVIAALHGDGRKVICYFSAGSYEDWRPDADAFPSSLLGESNGWPGEWWLDIRALDELRPIMAARFDLAVDKGCDGVEPDNIDAFLNQTGFEITPADQVAYAKWLSFQAHGRGLSIGMKNALALIPELETSFDWALNERCFEFAECELLTPFIDAGKAVFHVEYAGELDWCPRALELGFSSLAKDVLVGPDHRPCPEPG